VSKHNNYRCPEYSKFPTTENARACFVDGYVKNITGPENAEDSTPVTYFRAGTFAIKEKFLTQMEIH